jgi:3-deoxy-7-phosphoheptulonate synthase
MFDGSMKPLLTPRKLLDSAPLAPQAAQAVLQSRQLIRRCMEGLDERLLVIVGPCSVQDLGAMRDYAVRLSQLQKQLKDRVVLVLRAHFEKPRTGTGWKGFLYDPHLDGSGDMDYALKAMRQLLVEVANMGLPVATEFLEPTTPAYVADLISWATVGARTSSSQVHRQLASGLPMPVGFKNSTEGDIETAIQGLLSARSSHTFPNIDSDGRLALARTSGNPCTYLVLRGGAGRPNYDSAGEAASRLQEEGLAPRLVIDCGHDNCGRQHQRQAAVFRQLVEQRLSGSQAIAGLMIESNLLSGSQPARHPLIPGQSVTDPCIDWDTTQLLLEWTFEALGEAICV